MSDTLRSNKIKKSIPKLKLFCFGFSILFILLISGPILTDYSDSLAQAETSQPSPTGSRSGAIIVGIYDHSSTGDISYWTGGNTNTYTAYKSIVDNDPESRFTSKTITDLATSTLNTIDVLLLPDNAVPNADLDNVKNWFTSGKGIVGADSATCYLVYSGFLIPGYSNANGEDIYWEYDSNSGDQKILIKHKITEDYTVNNTYSSISGDVVYYKNKLPGDAICLTAKNSNLNHIYVVARDVPSYGRLVGLGPFASPPSGLEEFIRDSIEWVAKEYRFSIDPSDQFKYGSANEVLDFNFSILNQGAKNDTYDLSVLGNTFPTKIYDSTGTTEISSIYIVAHNQKDVIVRVSLPNNVDYRDSETGVFKVTSRGNSTIFDEANFLIIIPHYIPWSDDFEDKKLSLNWTSSTSPSYFGVNTKTANSGARSMYLSGTSMSITSSPIDTRGLEVLEISFWVRRGGYFSEIPDESENLIVEYLNATDTWKHLKTFVGGQKPGEIFDETFKLSGSALHNHFKLRFSQTSGSGPGVDYWHIDDVYIGPLRITLGLEMTDIAPASVIQGQTNVEMAKLTAKAMKGNVKITDLKLTLTGSASFDDIDNVRFVKDVDASGNFSSLDVILASGSFTSQSLMFTGSWSISEDITVSYLVLYNISVTATIGNTFGMRLGTNDIQVESPATIGLMTDFQSTNTTITEKPDYLLVSAQDKTPIFVEQGEKDVLVMLMPLMALTGSVVLTDLNLDLTYTGDITDISRIRLFDDVNNNNKLDSGTDKLLSTGKATGNKLSFPTLNFVINQGTAEKLLLIFDINLTATDGATIGVMISPDDVRVISPDLVKPFTPISCGPFNIIEQIDRLAPSAPIKLNVTNITYNSITLTWEPNFEDDVIGYNIYRNADSQPSTWNNLIGFSSKDNTEYFDLGLKENTEYYYVITALDEVPNESEYSNVVNGKTLLGPREPEIDFPYTEITIPEDVYDDSSLNLHKWFVDPNGDDLDFGFHGQKHIEITIFPENGTVILIPEENWNGDETVTFYAFDGTFKKFDQVKIIVTPVNDPPGPAEIISPKNNKEFKDNEPTSFFGSCSDPDLRYGDSLTFTWSSSIDGELGDGESLLNYPLSNGEHQITLSVKDKSNANSSSTINVVMVKTNGTPSKPSTPTTESPTKTSDDGLGYMILLIFLIIIICILVLIAFMWRRNKKLEDDFERQYLANSSSHEALPTPSTQPSITPPRSQPVISSTSPYTKYTGEQLQGYTSKPKEPVVIDMRPPLEQLPPKTQ